MTDTNPVGRTQVLAERYASAKRRAEALDAQLDEAKKEVATAEEALFSALEARNERSVSFDGLGSFRLNDLAWARIEDKEKALAWAEANQAEMVTLNHSQLSVVVREAIKGEREMPEGVDFTTSRKITWRKW